MFYIKNKASWSSTICLLIPTVIVSFCRCLCVAESIDVETCRFDDSYNVSRDSGYISSNLPGVPAVCDDTQRPWVISVQHGQRINVTLVNFTPLTANQLRLTSFQPHNHLQLQIGHVLHSIWLKLVKLCKFDQIKPTHNLCKTRCIAKPSVSPPGILLF